MWEVPNQIPTREHCSFMSLNMLDTVSIASQGGYKTNTALGANSQQDYSIYRP